MLPDVITQDTVDSFTNYFADVGRSLTAQFSDTSGHTCPSRPVSGSFGIFEIELPHLLSVVKTLDGSKAAGLDSMTVKFIKVNIDILAVHLLHMFRHWQDCGMYPNELKLVGILYTKMVTVQVPRVTVQYPG